MRPQLIISIKFWVSALTQSLTLYKSLSAYLGHPSFRRLLLTVNRLPKYSKTQQPSKQCVVVLCSTMEMMHAN